MEDVVYCTSPTPQGLAIQGVVTTDFFLGKPKAVELAECAAFGVFGECVYQPYLFSEFIHGNI